MGIFLYYPNGKQNETGFIAYCPFYCKPIGNSDEEVRKLFIFIIVFEVYAAVFRSCDTKPVKFWAALSPEPDGSACQKSAPTRDPSTLSTYF
jgi:hypothetical protein